MKIGVLGLQGDVREHQRALETAGASPVLVKHAAELNDVDALVIPGGESTTIGKLLDRFALLDPLRERVASGMPVYGTCAGLILMAAEVVLDEFAVGNPHDAPHRLGSMDVAVTRNAYGRQVDSFETDLDIAGLDEPFRAVFIRAPTIERTGADVEVLATFEDRPVLVRQRNMLASTFHPEMTGDARVHELFIQMAAA
ncbi:MAG TPA: pyridoxal 5'-phosphate synthase glutaminase subunit PdxT [Actinomycetota bacterium]|nr:pyridoxal 5'-phosphate synthase glutaminase subunit PdxT [Actinomycetota bacterium]